ncbi:MULTISPECIES: NAD(P)/FAD-dependent oxidoreductase [Pseudomonas]|uniref:NAD(P)/FAD-dependent oxidoreductase n=1 Tax=Pseudomonas TaxID=286 RepID=UPI00049AF9E5|nr:MULTISPECIES: FAD-dependent oxidoreductase [unclassified Pseudomonas]AOS74311.1 FAD-binding oxidoreductase [Pseudomonas fluorescens]AIB42476.1 FAD-binding oxidoreductase [Pseudomonas sp. WCS374]NKI47942.1 FAD-binding oxidoreductase [Pseudomonas fluorescens]NKI54657.1 FAD-binding oxidoreductase [Pseudomonas fluorescens]NKI66042.1 FAD-binding oxidoreductase [Pseudomonas fluorescens]
MIDVIVLGGGIVGASAALVLAQKGQRVALVERDFCGSHSSGVNYGGVRRQGRPLHQLPLSQRAHQLWADLPGLIGIEGEYVRCGHLKLARSPGDFAALQAYADQTRGFGLGLQLLDRSELRKRFPWVGDVAVGASLCPDDGHANPRLVSPAFARAAQRHGAAVYEQAEVIRIAHDSRLFQVHCANGLHLQAPWLLNCAGAWAGKVAAQLGEPVPIISAHPAMLVTEPLRGVMTVSTGVEGGGIYARQVARGNCILGGGRGFALGPQQARPGQAAVLEILRNAGELYPFLQGAQAIRTWSGTEGYLPDNEPVIGPSSTQPGLLHGFGFAGAGFQLGPAVGEALAEIVCDGACRQPIEAFSIRRFQA